MARFFYSGIPCRPNPLDRRPCPTPTISINISVFHMSPFSPWPSRYLSFFPFRTTGSNKCGSISHNLLPPVGLCWSRRSPPIICPRGFVIESPTPSRIGFCKPGRQTRRTPWPRGMPRMRQIPKVSPLQLLRSFGRRALPGKGLQF